MEKKMTSGKESGIGDFFSDVIDPRQEWKIHHSLKDILTITICAVISGADSWEEIENYGKCKVAWLKTFLLLQNGIPSADTFGRVLSLINPREFEKCFLEWVKSVTEITAGNIISIDGKTLRRSYDKKSDKAAIHMVSAWSSLASCVLGQLKTEEKSNEITAIPELLKVLDLHGCIVTIDAMGTQKIIARQIIGGGGEYLLAVKGNQPSLHEEITGFFKDAAENDFNGIEHSFFEEKNKGHGRIEHRKYWTVENIEWMKCKDEWKGLKMIGMTESERTVDGKTSTEQRFFIGSIEGEAKTFAGACRKHWGIENSLHWCLDIAFREDECRIRKGFASENLAIVRHIALNLLKKEKTNRKGIKAKRLLSGWDNDYLLKVLKTALAD
jgi:predicted transposase YbfD/YdcC